MSQRQVSVLLDALLRDPDVGWSITFDRLSGAMGGGAQVRSDFNFVPWWQPIEPAPTTQPNVAMRVTGWEADIRYPGTNQRDGTCTVDVSFEIFAAEPRDLSSELALAGVALMQVLDQLPSYSESLASTYGTFVEFDGRVQFFPDDALNPTARSFVARFTLLERSVTD